MNDTINPLFLDLRDLKQLKSVEFMGYLRSEMKHMESLHEYAEYRGLDAWEYDRDYAALLREAERFATMEEWADYA